MSKINKIRLSGTTYEIEDSGATKTVELTQAQYDALVSGGTVDPNTFYVITDATAADLSQYWTSAQTQSAITEATSGKVDASTYETYTAATDTALSGKQDTLSAGTNITIVDNVISAEGGSITVDPSLDSGSTNAVANSAITEALSGKQDTLVSGTNIKTINNESILGSGNITIEGGGGGKAIEAGRGISVTTGTTADTVSFNLPISASTIAADSIVGGYFGNSSMSQYGFAFGDNAKCGNGGTSCMAFGRNVLANSQMAFVAGGYNTATNKAQAAFGQYTVNNKANGTWGDSGNTLFSVGNGTADNARHNAFEIRQNGDIYIGKGGSDVKLQDIIPSTTSAVTSGSTAVVESGAVYDQLGGMKIVKLTESEYTALVTKDESTLYVVLPDPSN